MAIETLEQETHFLLQAVAEYRVAYAKNGYLGKLAPYGHIDIPDRSSHAEYGLGGCIYPLQLTDILPILLEQHRISLICFEKYSDLVREQLSAIHKFYIYRT